MNPTEKLSTDETLCPANSPKAWINLIEKCLEKLRDPHKNLSGLENEAISLDNLYYQFLEITKSKDPLLNSGSKLLGEASIKLAMDSADDLSQTVTLWRRVVEANDKKPNQRESVLRYYKIAFYLAYTAFDQLKHEVLRQSEHSDPTMHWLFSQKQWDDQEP